MLFKKYIFLMSWIIFKELWQILWWHVFCLPPECMEHCQSQPAMIRSRFLLLKKKKREKKREIAYLKKAFVPSHLLYCRRKKREHSTVVFGLDSVFIREHPSKLSLRRPFLFLTLAADAIPYLDEPKALTLHLTDGGQHKELRRLKYCA